MFAGAGVSVEEQTDQQLLKVGRVRVKVSGARGECNLLAIADQAKQLGPQYYRSATQLRQLFVTVSRNSMRVCCQFGVRPCDLCGFSVCRKFE